MLHHAITGILACAFVGSIAWMLRRSISPASATPLDDDQAREPNFTSELLCSTSHPD